jgi:SAM-dependent methyltransferase
MATGSAGVQGDLWGARALDWANVQEPLSRPVYDAVLEHIALGPDTTLLDVGCGAGMFLALAAAAGAEVTGLDAAPRQLAVARERVPQADLVPGELEDLPFGDETFDVVTALGSLEYADQPVAAAREIARVARRGAPVAASVPADPKASDVAAAFAALAPLRSAGMIGPFDLAEPGSLEGVLRQAGLEVTTAADVVCVWEYADLETALRGLLATGPAVEATRHSGEPAVIEAVTRALEPFMDGRGRYRLENVVRLAIATS